MAICHILKQMIVMPFNDKLDISDATIAEKTKNLRNASLTSKSHLRS